MKNKLKNLLKRIVVAILARADALVTKLLMKFVPNRANRIKNRLTELVK